jgi:hypothetical protein
MTHLYVVLDTDDEDNLVVKPTEKTIALDLFAQQGTFPAWNIVGEGYIVTIYGGVLEGIPVGENREEIEGLVLRVLGLRPWTAGLELQLIVTQSPDVEEFRDSVGINIVIPATDIAICGIFVWGKHQADLKIYETSLLRANARLYIEVLQIAVEIADRIAKRGVQTLPEIRSALLEIAQTFDKANLRLK